MLYLEITPKQNNDVNNKFLSELAISTVHSAIVRGHKVYITFPWIVLHPNIHRQSQLRVIRIFSEDKKALEKIASVFDGIGETNVKEYKPSSSDQFYSFSNVRILSPSRLASLNKRKSEKGIGISKKPPVIDDGLPYVRVFSQSNQLSLTLRIKAIPHTKLDVSGRTSSYGLATREPGNIVSLPIFE